MRICFPVTEIFSYGVYGGFGALTRKIARGLAEKGHEVYIVTPRFTSQKPIEVLDNFTVVSHARGLKNTYNSKHIYKVIDADVYHSEEPSLGTWLAEKAVPERKHIVTFQDPRTIHDHRKEWKHLTKKQRLRMEAIMKGMYFVTKRAVKKTNAQYIQALYAIPKARRVYKLKKNPLFLPNPIEISKRLGKKESKPTVCFLARWDPRKRVEYFFELAKKFSDVDFIAMGKTQPHFADRDKMLREKYKDVRNLTMTGFVTEEEKTEILDRSWIMINTSWRECLPIAYLEAAAHKCAILSHENPDNFASERGYHAVNGTFEEFREGLKWLLEDDRWKKLGTKGYEYVDENHEFNKVIDMHVEAYEKVLGER
jgi:glycosyltransferase involved in cell wall biosynthesis